MPPSAQADIFHFHEQRLNSLDNEVAKVASEQASVVTKLDHLNQKIEETKSEISEKLDLLLEKVGAVDDLKARIGSLESSRKSFKTLFYKVALPVGLVLMGLLTGAEGASIWKVIVKAVGGE